SIRILRTLPRHWRGKAVVANGLGQCSTLGAREIADSDVTVVAEAVAHVRRMPFGLEIKQSAQRQRQCGKFDSRGCPAIRFCQLTRKVAEQTSDSADHVRAGEAVIVVVHLRSSIDDQVVAAGQLQAIKFYPDGEDSWGYRNPIEESNLSNGGHT